MIFLPPAAYLIFDNSFFCWGNKQIIAGESNDDHVVSFQVGPEIKYCGMHYVICRFKLVTYHLPYYHAKTFTWSKVKHLLKNGFVKATLCKLRRCLQQFPSGYPSWWWRSILTELCKRMKTSLLCANCVDCFFRLGVNLRLTTLPRKAICIKAMEED